MVRPLNKDVHVGFGNDGIGSVLELFYAPIFFFFFFFFFLGK